MIYLDYNATTPIDPAVADVMEPFIRQHFGNPSSLHPEGSFARRAVEQAREQTALLLGAAPDEIVFTSGGSESNNMALKGAIADSGRRKAHLITSVTEHPSVLNVCRWLERQGHDITYLPVDHYGRVRAAGLAAAMRPDTRLVSIMHANNETGTIQPIAELADIAHASGALFHCDAAQSAGKIACHVNELKVDLLTIAGHKLYAPKGIGALYIRRGTRVEPLIHGAGQESGRRAGTENVMLAAALGKACELAIPQTGDPSLKVLTDQFFAMLQATWGSLAVLNGHPVERLPNTLNISFTGWQGQAILDRLDHVAASTGSACHAGMTEISPVLKAMGLDEAAARGAVRFSLGRMTTNDEIKAVVRQLTTFIERPAGPRSGGIGSRDDL